MTDVGEHPIRDEIALTPQGDRTPDSLDIDEPDVLHIIPQEEAEHLISEVEGELSALEAELAFAREAADAAEARLRELEDQDPELMQTATDRMVAMLGEVRSQAERDAARLLEDARDEAARITRRSAPRPSGNGNAVSAATRRTTPLVAAPEPARTRHATVATAMLLVLWAMIATAVVVFGLTLAR